MYNFNILTISILTEENTKHSDFFHLYKVNDENSEGIEGMKKRMN